MNVDLLLAGPLEIIFSKIGIKIQTFFPENAFRSDTCMMSTIMPILNVETEQERSLVAQKADKLWKMKCFLFI